MKSKNIEKMAAQDAVRWAEAEMFYGEGAGTRRKLLDAELGTKFQMAGYGDAFYRVYNDLDKGALAEKAIKERQRIDRAAKAGKNLRALKSGNYRNLSTGLYVAVGVTYVLYATGYDKKIKAEAKKLYSKAKTEARYQKARRQGLNVEKLF